MGEEALSLTYSKAQHLTDKWLVSHTGHETLKESICYFSLQKGLGEPQNQSEHSSEKTLPSSKLRYFSKSQLPC
jgi:hypothetical protein